MAPWSGLRRIGRAALGIAAVLLGLAAAAVGAWLATLAPRALEGGTAVACVAGIAGLLGTGSVLVACRAFGRTRHPPAGTQALRRVSWGLAILTMLFPLAGAVLGAASTRGRAGQPMLEGRSLTRRLAATPQLEYVFLGPSSDEWEVIDRSHIPWLIRIVEAECSFPGRCYARSLEAWERVRRWAGERFDWWSRWRFEPPLARNAIGKLTWLRADAAEAVPLLHRIARGRDVALALQAAACLGEIGPAARPAIADIVTLFERVPPWPYDGGKFDEPGSRLASLVGIGGPEAASALGRLAPSMDRERVIHALEELLVGDWVGDDWVDVPRAQRVAVETELRRLGVPVEPREDD